MGDQLKTLQKIINTIEDSLDYLCTCNKEKYIHNVLSARLKCKSRQILSSPQYPNVEVDLIGDNYTIEVKYNAKYYSGISQVLIQKYLYQVKNVYLLHLHKFLNKPFINAFEKLSERLNFIGLLIDKRSQKLMVFNNGKKD
jgi:hypothetical protein